MTITYSQAVEKVAAALRREVSQMGEFCQDWDDDEYRVLAHAALQALYGGETMPAIKLTGEEMQELLVAVRWANQEGGFELSYGLCKGLGFTDEEMQYLGVRPPIIEAPAPIDTRCTLGPAS